MDCAALPIIPVLTGPTGTGKTELALRLGRLFPLAVISADASMVYRGMDIGTAKPSQAQREAVKHHLIDVVWPDQRFSVTDFIHLAEEAIQETLAQGQVPLVVGGTGYYIRALSEGMHTLPEPDSEVQAELWKLVERQGIEPLLQELERASPEDAQRVQRNPRRLVRAVEVLRRTGLPPARFPKRVPRFRYRKLVLWPDWAWLEPRLELRVAGMFTQGLVQEVEGLLAAYPQMPTALQGIGYKEVAGYLRGAYGLEEARKAIIRATRAYAKRQYTWFRKEPGEVTFLPHGGDEAWPGVLGWFRQALE
ncbi:tRNA delta(2)-isopentenylpyrophosphate transferase [Meiothermus ruber DSM 1279]|jgi:tRNA dimethylallyltransferase|uniref:tRNA dimethylallyltransferase n=1 Tax=Meiothermus ruber (strain ATCC 35948 / DSM 1279 / VKM B-1258 / 21) TaxID=504728 RepID=D3PRN4_MEIRD|nr:tRNA delta(2)-isopentenylpyrophosphate transferase [Meiothermus ruber DSM 1279]AGK04587.1 tRNA delta(2)-isopentenylpyrophosphate transferase [Meiothermus ruber DSM 1279]GAO75066.1 tRNA delta(2)-isopentenylpyrophosphate transferase [Meiothermus ruber H328]